MFYKIDGVKLFQLVQTDKNTINIKIVKNKDFKNDDVDIIFNELRKRLGELDFMIEFVDSIERDKKTGKIRCVKNEIKKISN
jgi:hypothetical protein